MEPPPGLKSEVPQGGILEAAQLSIPACRQAGLSLKAKVFGRESIKIMGSRRCFSDLGFAKLDIDRKSRRGFSEVVYSTGKTKEQLKTIIRDLIRHKQDILLTKLDKRAFTFLKKTFPALKYNPIAKIAFVAKKQTVRPKGLIAVVSAGTADIPVAEEAAVTLEVMGEQVIKLYDVGVAGVHRLWQNLEKLRQAKAIIVVAGMEGALASLISGLVSSPVIAVPTSCGYGANFAGLSALLTMLNSCSPGVVTVNIDNGFGAGYFAALINKP